ncbi:MAG: class I SAM-dependent methyltransferase [Chlamydiales bacterium]|nr:class I SAM-dependent methyltransferase [Chlamydiales bacterium]
MRLSLCLLSFLLCSSSFATVYDCFSFYNELEILEIRLNELNDHVDKFVLVEATHTHKGLPKPLYFSENKERFSKFLDKIICIVVDLPESYTARERTEDANFEREVFQRDQIMQALSHCSNDDIIFISDVDEIWRGDCFDQISSPLKSGRYDKVGICMALYFYFLDRLGFIPWDSAGATTYGYLKTITPSIFRGIISGYYGGKKVDWKAKNAAYYLKNGGWHFTWMGGADRVKAKFEAYAHGSSIEVAPQGEDELMINGHRTRQVSIDETYPRYVQQNIDHFRKLNFIYDNRVDLKWEAYKAEVLSRQHEVEGFCSREKAEKMMDLIHDTYPLVCVEIGVYGGASIYPTCQALKYLGNGMVYAVDPWSKEECLVGYETGGAAYNWWNALDMRKIYRGFLSVLKRNQLKEYCSVKRMTSAKAVTRFADESVDILHVDGNHSAEQALFDVEKWFPKVKKGGYIWFDDVSWTSTSQAVSYLKEHCSLDVSRSSSDCYLFKKE